MTAFRPIEELLRATPVLPVVTISAAAVAAELARAVLRGGIGAIEVTLRTTVALEAIAAIAREVSGIAVGAGTVLNPLDLQRAAEAGAAFAVSPGTTPELLAAGRAGAPPYLPGVATAGEIQRGIAAGYGCFKFFPAAGAGGIAALKGFAGPFPQVLFCATGGITAESAQSYLDLPNVLAVGGSWIAPPELIERREWNVIEARAREAAELLRSKAKA